MSKAKNTAVKTTKPKSVVKRTASADVKEGDVKLKGIFYVVYVDTYISDEEILPRGVYKVEAEIERLENSKPQYVRKFEGAIPQKIIHEVAETLKVSVTDKDGNFRDSAEILAEIVKEI